MDDPVDVSDAIAILAACPIASPCWRETDSNLQFPATGSFVKLNRWSAAMPQPNDPGLRRGRL
jgi:hypothetical protein